ncbi:MAG: winged helix-turn-helix transcriptional regulator, partial [Bacteroidales bacterium]|nr:winged helix-turn-helix transcriptional regulator [Bacteroidales bacterium]
MKEQKEKLMRQVVKQLHDDYRIITEMRYFDEMSYTEIAEKLDLPLGTVKARLFRSRELLLSIVKDINLNKDRI